MKINKYINAFFATAILAAGVASCTNDDTVDSKGLYVINLKTTGLNEEQQAAFNKVVKSKTFGVDVDEAYQQTYGLYSSEAYAQARYNDVVSSSIVLDSIVNVYADQSNVVDFSVNVVLMKDSTAVLQSSQAIMPTVKRENYTITVDQTDGSLDATGLQTLADKTKQIIGVAPNTTETVSCTPGYVKGRYLSTLAKTLADTITTLVPAKGASVIFEDFSEKITVKKDGTEIGTVTVSPYCDYVAWYDVTMGSLSDNLVTELQAKIKQDIFNGLESYPWDKRQKINRSSAFISYNNLLITKNNAIQKIVNEFAATNDITDFSLNIHLSVADGVTQPVGHNWLTFTEQDRIFTPNIVKKDYKVVYEVQFVTSVSKEMDEKFGKKLEGIKTPDLSNMYESNAVVAYNNWLNEEYVDPESSEVAKNKDLVQYLAVKFKDLDFVLTFKMLDAQNNVITKTIYKASEGWIVGQ